MDRGHALTVRRELREAGGRVAAPTQLANGQRKFRARLIAGDVQGSSGYYPASVIERDGPRAFPKGTQMHLDHQSFMEMWSKPEGSIKDLAGVIYSDPVYERGNPQGDGLYADVLLFSEHAEMLTELAPWIGVSIVAICASEAGANPATGESTDIITEIIAGARVDFVTHPGADGRITQIIEAHRPPTAESVGVPGAKEVRIDAVPLSVSESAGSSERGVEMDKETADALKTALESLVAPMTALTTALNTEAAARQAKESKTEDDGKPDIATVISTAVEALTNSGLPKPSRDRVIAQVSAGTVLAEAITAEKKYLGDLGIVVTEGAPFVPNGAGSNGQNGGGYVADRSGSGSADGVDLVSAWWMSEAGSVSKNTDSKVIESSTLLAAWGA